MECSYLITFILRVFKEFALNVLHRNIHIPPFLRGLRLIFNLSYLSGGYVVNIRAGINLFDCIFQICNE